jgi:hypothetical protein
MDDIATYRDLVKNIIREFAALPASAVGDVTAEIAFDDDRGHYQLMHVGWEGPRRVHGVVLHVDIHDGQIWIQHDGTEGGIADELLAAGVPHERIVLAFHHPDKRRFTPFAVH